MKINNQSKILDKQYQAEIKSKEERIKEINDAYNKKIQDISEASDNEIREKRNLEREKISQELDLENERWEEVRKKWNKKNALMEDQKIKEENNQKDELIANRLGHGEKMEKEQEAINKNIISFKEQGDKRLNELKEANNYKIYQEEIKSRKNMESYSNFSQQKQREIDRAIAEKERENQAALRDIKEENARQLNEREKINQENLKRMDESNKNKLSMAEKGFKEKIERMQRESDQTIENLSLQSQKEINKIKQSESRDKGFIKNRSNDPFYLITNLNPKLTNNEKEYFLRLSVPEHEKDSVTVDGNGRNLKISQTRRFSDETKNEDGTVNKSSRSEVISQSVKLEDNINPRKISHSYKDNELIFKIPKA